MNCGGLGTAFLLLSHIPQAAAAYIAACRGIHVVAASLVVSALATAAYHTYECLDYSAADPGVRAAWHAAQVEAYVLAAANFAVVATSALVRHNVTIGAYAAVTAFAAAVYAFSWGKEAHYGLLAAIPVAVSAVYWAARYARWRAARATLQPAAPPPMRRRDATTPRAAAAALVGVVAGLAAQAFLAKSTRLYVLWHSLWHLGTGTAMAFAMTMWPPTELAAAPADAV